MEGMLRPALVVFALSAAAFTAACTAGSERAAAPPASTGASPPAAAHAAPAGADPSSAGDHTSPADRSGPGTRAMEARLRAIVKGINPEDNLFLNRQRAAGWKEYLAHASSDPADYLDLQPRYAKELLSAGETQEAIKALTDLQEFVKKRGFNLNEKHRSFLLTSLGVANLRLGEQENCLAHHTTESCLLPIRGGGIHTFQRGSRAAIEVLADELTQYPEDLAARWLINIAYMTVGEYPDKVPKAWLIPPKVFQSDVEVKRFTDIAGGLGLAVDDLAGGSVADDFDNDGYLDIVVSTQRLLGNMHLFHNNADGTFTDKTDEAGLRGEMGGLNMVQADYDNDGDLDIFLMRGAWMNKGGRFPKSLLRNNGDGSFEDVTVAAGIEGEHPSQTGVWIDYDSDGWLDLYVGNESQGDEIHPSQLFHNNHDGSFTECADAAGMNPGGLVKAVVSGDYNLDGRPDIYVSRNMETNLLYRNDGPRPGAAGNPCAWQFTETSKTAGVAQQAHSFPAWFFDYDNDGWPDIFVAGYMIPNGVADIASDYLGQPNPGEKARLYHNNHDGTFTDTSHATHLDRILHGMGSNFGDIDNDGWLDFYIGTGNPDLTTLIPNRMYRNAEGKLFQDVTTSAGVGHLQKGHGVSFADLDNDGDQDVFEKMGGAAEGDNYRSVLYENPGYGRHWITLRLEGVKENRSAIGVRLKLAVATDKGRRFIYRTIGSGGSFGCNPLRQEIGLGDARGVESITIDWPASKQTETITGLAMDRFYSIRQGDGRAVPIALKTFRFKPGA
jgi:FG-GAP-like repeat/ASPIC and UnbV